jgi:hypothetical protein
MKRTVLHLCDFGHELLLQALLSQGSRSNVIFEHVLGYCLTASLVEEKDSKFCPLYTSVKSLRMRVWNFCRKQSDSALFKWGLRICGF